MSELEVIEHEAAVEYRPQHGTLFGTDDPWAVVEKASKVAGALANVVKAQGLTSRISGRDYCRVEAWTLLGSMLGVFPVTVWTKPVGDGQGWEARVEARTRDGAIVGAAEAECLRSEKTWANRDSYALRSMAQTRATSKALRHPLGFVMTIAGFEATPEEEMPRDEPAPEPAAPAVKQPRSYADWQARMLELGVPDAEAWAREAVEKSGIREGKMKRLNEVLTALVIADFDAFSPDPDGQVRAAFSLAFGGVMVDGPPKAQVEGYEVDSEIPFGEDGTE